MSTVKGLKLEEDADGRLRFAQGPALDEATKLCPEYVACVPRYVDSLGRLFERAAAQSEWDFILSLLRVRSMQDAGWDPFETTLRAIPSIRDHINSLDSFDLSRHLALWMYGHIYEAAEPYELIANLIETIDGGGFRTEHFPRSKRGTEPSPTKKLEWLAKRARAIGEEAVIATLAEGWDPAFRNAAFHADYCLHGGAVRTLRPGREYSRREVAVLFNRAVGYFDAVAGLYCSAIRSYGEPKEIPTPPGFSRDPGQKATVIVREGHGAVGVMAMVTSGDETFRVLLGRFTPEESRMLDADQSLVLLPPATPELDGGTA